MVENVDFSVKLEDPAYHSAEISQPLINRSVESQGLFQKMIYPRTPIFLA
jgi:hypothetical protein